VGYLVLDEDRQPVGVIGFVDPDPASQVMWLDGHARPGASAHLDLVRNAVPVVLDEAERSGAVLHVYYETFRELNDSIIEDTKSLWVCELDIPNFAMIEGLWCSRQTYRLDMSTWSQR
jgi:hypothetical protein